MPTTTTTYLLYHATHGTAQALRRIASRLRLLAALVLLCGATPLTAQFRYDTEHPLIGYGKVETSDAFSRLMRQRGADGAWLAHDALGRGYLDSLLAALDIDPASQVLVFSKSSLKQRFITPETPRALFFNDEVYVGFVPGSTTLEVGAMDPALGPVFFDFSQRPDAPLRFEQETARCLRCHDTYSLTGGGVPRFMLSTMLVGPDGSAVSHELSEMTTTATPIQRRWGGWYVTGTHGAQTHMGNLIIGDPAALVALPTQGVGNLTSLDTYADLGIYPRQTSDIVALLVLEHQVEVQNSITRLNYGSRTLLAGTPAPDAATLDTLVRALLDALFMTHEAPLAAPVTGSSEFGAGFSSKGPRDSQGRSLRDLDLQTRTFRYPLSYLIYSDAIASLPEPVRTQLFAAIRAVLEGARGAPDYPHLSADQRSAILGILRDTRPDLFE